MYKFPELSSLEHVHVMVVEGPLCEQARLK